MTGRSGDPAVRLPDGRTLGYAEFGDPDGFTILNCHGGLTSRLDIADCDEAALAAGVRIISPDRPGIGLSDREPGRSLLDWPDDAAHLLDELGVDQFGALGWSAGGAYAAACGFALADRVQAIGLVASTVPPSAMTGNDNRMDRLFTRLSTRAPALDRLAFGVMGGFARLSPVTFHRLSALGLDRPSRAKVMEMAPGAYSRAIATGLRDPAGVVDEYRILGSEWGFDPEQIAAPARIWQGDSDGFVPVEWSEWLAKRLAKADLLVCPGEGHFLALGRYSEIFAWFRSASP
jgi:pimeloyl-ACP methyl ester carboxylesterase